MAKTATAQRAEHPRQETSRSAHGSFHWNELVTQDVERAKAFYGATLGWSFEAMPMPEAATYWVAKAGGQPVGGMFDTRGRGCESASEGWLPYIAVDDVDMRVARAVAAGAKVVKAPFDVPGVGRIAVLQAPGGAGIGWITPAG